MSDDELIATYVPPRYLLSLFSASLSLRDRDAGLCADVYDFVFFHPSFQTDLCLTFFRSATLLLFSLYLSFCFFFFPHIFPFCLCLFLRIKHQMNHSLEFRYYWVILYQCTIHFLDFTYVNPASQFSLLSLCHDFSPLLAVSFSFPPVIPQTSSCFCLTDLSCHLSFLHFFF